jgi:hypothetical protein
MGESKLKNLLRVPVISTVLFWLAGCTTAEPERELSVAEKFQRVEASLNRSYAEKEADNAADALQSATDTQTLLIVLILVVAVGILIVVLAKKSKKD